MKSAVQAAIAEFLEPETIRGIKELWLEEEDFLRRATGLASCGIGTICSVEIFANFRS